LDLKVGGCTLAHLCDFFLELDYQGLAV